MSCREYNCTEVCNSSKKLSVIMAHYTENVTPRWMKSDQQTFHKTCMIHRMTCQHVNSPQKTNLPTAITCSKLHNYDFKSKQLSCIHLWFYGVLFASVIKPCNINFTIKMANVTDDGIILHLHEMFRGDDSTASCWCDKDLSLGGSFFHGDNFIPCQTKNT